MRYPKLCQNPQLYWGFIYLVPLVLLIGFVSHFGPSIPLSDEWRIVNFFEKFHEGSRQVSDFFYENNEHLSLSPLVLVTFFAFLSNWDLQCDRYLGVFFSALTFLSIYYLSHKQSARNLDLNSYYFHAANILSCILIFSLVQWEIWLWGWASVMWQLTNVCFMLALISLYCFQRLPGLVRLAIAAIFCAIASFSAGYGLMSWLVLIPAVFLLDHRLKYRIFNITFWISLFILIFGFYTDNYQAQSDINFIFKHPLFSFQYWLNLSGSPLASSFFLSSQELGLGLSSIIGGVMLTTFLLLAILLIWKRNSIASEVIPWISLGLFSILFGLLTTLGRAKFGIENPTWSMSSRYNTASIFLVISLVQIISLIIRQRRTHIKVLRRKGVRLFSRCLVSLITVGIFISHSMLGLSQGKLFHVNRSKVGRCLEVIHFMEPPFLGCLQYEYSSVNGNVGIFSKTLENIGFRSFPKDIQFNEDPSREYGQIEVPETIEIHSQTNVEEKMQLSGWIKVSDKAIKKGVLLLLSYENKRTFFASQILGSDAVIRPEISGEGIVGLNWTIDCPIALIPSEKQVIKAWIYQSGSKQFNQLSGAIFIQ